MEYREKILELARKEPLLPSIAAKALSTNSILAGAMLSEMCSKGLLKTSTLKVGGSPLYYAPGNERQLLNHLSSLNEKDKRTTLKLQQEKIIRDTESDALTRFSLRQIKDFARELTVSHENTQEIFWKWFEISDQEAETLIKMRLESKIPRENKKTEPEKIAEQQKSTNFSGQEIRTNILEAKKTEQTGKEQEHALLNEQTTGFTESISGFFAKNKILISEKISIKKTELDLIIKIQSPVGALTYYCKARSKKKITEADISNAYVQGQLKKLPVVFLTDGELTKQARALLEQLKGITLAKV